MRDFKVVNVPAMLEQLVTVTDEDGNTCIDKEWNQESALTQYVLAEFLADKKLLLELQAIVRKPDLVINWTELTETGQKFIKDNLHKWLNTVDTTGITELKMREKLERRWKKFGI